MSLPDIPCLTNSTHKYSIHVFHPPPSQQTALPLHIPPCHQSPRHHLHLPSPDHPLRIQVEGPLIAIQKLLPKTSWHTADHTPLFPMPGGPELAKLAFQTIYLREAQPDVPGDMVIRDEYTGWLEEARPDVMIDYYGITFDHLVPIDDISPEVLQVNIMEIEDDGGMYANKYSCFNINPVDYSEKQVLALPRCCQTRKGTTDRKRVNDSVNRRDGRA